MSKAKPIFTLFLGLYLIILLINLIFPLSSFAQTEEEEETLTIATYYPAPYGVYNEMRAKKMAVGDNYYGGSQFCWPPDTCANQIDGISSSCWPNCNTDLIVEGNVGIGTARPDKALQVNGNIKMVDGNQAAGKVLTSDANGTGSWQTAAGKVVQMVYFQTGEYASGPILMSYKNSIPLNSEGNEFMSLTITPTSAESILEITVVANATSNNNAPTMALFQDNQVQAIAATYFVGYAQWITPMTINHFMQAGTTGPTTFKVRIGSANGTTYFNGQIGGRKLGGVYASSVSIKEYLPN